MSAVLFAIAIIRVSSTKQGLQGDSPEDQLIQIKLRAKQLSAILNCNIIIKKVFELTESASGEPDTQPVLAAIHYCRDPKNKIKYFFIKSIDRFTRGGSTTYGLLKAQLTRYDVQLIDCYGVVSNQQVNTLSHLDIEYKWSKYSPSYITEILEAERGKEEVRAILTRMIGAEVRYVRLGYRVRGAPLGYQNEKIETDHGKRTILVPHSTESIWVTRMYELRAGNKTDEQIVNEVNAMGFKSRDRKKHDPLNTKRIIGTIEGKPLDVKQLQQYIKNPIYASVNCEKWTNNLPIKERFDGLVSIDLWNRANRGKFAIVEADNKISIIRGKVADYLKRKVKDNPLFPYRKYINCQICHLPLYGSTSRGGTGLQHSYYHCSRFS